MTPKKLLVLLAICVVSSGAVVGYRTVSAGLDGTASAERINEVASRVPLPDGIVRVGTSTYTQGCSGGCPGRSDFLCSAASPEVSLDRLVAAWMGAEPGMRFTTDRHVASGSSSVVRVTIDADPTGRLDGESKNKDRTCADSGQVPVNVYVGLPTG